MGKELIYIKEGKEGYYEEKKSKFLSAVYPVENEAQALAILEAVRKKYWDARHNCYAMVIGDHNELTRCSDDGEPSGTAGKPMLEILLGREIHNCLVVVTRYFGGTLLGTGGLVRAYQKAAADALENSTLVRKIPGSSLFVDVDYTGAGKIQYAAAKEEIEILSMEYGEKVQMQLAVPEDAVEKMVKAITELTSGKAKIREEKCEIFY